MTNPVVDKMTELLGQVIEDKTCEIFERNNEDYEIVSVIILPEFEFVDADRLGAAFDYDYIAVYQYTREDESVAAAVFLLKEVN